MRFTEREENEERPVVGTGKFTGQELVAVRVRSRGPAIAVASDTNDYYYLYWFEPTEDFLAALPVDVRNSIKRERGMPPSGDDAAVPLRPIALVGTSMHPNPATSDVATVDYTLTDARRVAISVYDITGERVRDVAVSDTRASGMWQDNVSFEGIPNGYYLLAVTTDQGEQSIQPIILKR
ncbi:MAG: T9SS type A sorting domain-containing protein [Bacteroidota bacterium]